MYKAQGAMLGGIKREKKRGNWAEVETQIRAKR